MIAKTSERALAAGSPPSTKQDITNFSADELFALARNKSVEGRRALFSTVCDIFLGESLTLSDR